MPILEAFTGGVWRYTIPASNAFGLPYPCGYGNPPAACQGNPLKPLWEKWRKIMYLEIRKESKKKNHRRLMAYQKRVGKQRREDKGGRKLCQ